MKFAILKSRERTIDIVDVPDAHDAYRLAGLTPLAVDHGILSARLAIVVDECGLTRTTQTYFSIERRLFGGNAVLYSFDEAGATIDYHHDVRCTWFGDDLPAIEDAIRRGDVLRPQLAGGGEVLWSWPDPPPSHETRLKLAQRIAEQHGSVVIDDDIIITKVPHG